MKTRYRFFAVSLLCLMLLLPAISVAEDSDYFYMPNPYVSDDGVVYVGPFGSDAEMNNQNNYSSYPETNQQISVPTGGPGFGEPFYPNNPPSPEPQYTPEPTQQMSPVITPNQEIVYSEPFYPNNPPSPGPQYTPEPTQQMSPVISPNKEIVYSEPFYPDNPPSPGPQYTPEPTQQISPVIIPNQEIVYSEPFYPAYPPGPGPSDTPSQPISSEPFYPAYPPSPEPYPTPVPTERPSVYYPTYRYPDTSVTIHERWEDSSYQYRSPYYRDSWYYSDRDYVYGTIEVASSPIRAEVFVDNRFRGYTPSSGYLKLYDIRPGSYTIRLRYSGYYDYYEDIYVFRGRTTTVYGKMNRIGDPIQRTGLLSIQSEPTGAGIYLDNEYKGITPVSLRNVPSGERNLLLRKEGYADYISRIQIVEDQTISIAAILNQIPRTPEPVITAAMVEAPLPSPTRAGSEMVIIIISIIGSMIFLSSKRQ